MGVMLQPDISSCEVYWYVRPWQVKYFPEQMCETLL
jgi:hypothetical protein